MKSASSDFLTAGALAKARSKAVRVRDASTAPSTPTDVTIAVNRVVVLMPEAMPVRLGGTHAMIAFCVSPFNMPAPQPVTIMPSATSQYFWSIDTDAVSKFPAAVKEALDQAIEEAREYRREASSRIVVPDGLPGPGPLPGGGKIKL